MSQTAFLGLRSRRKICNGFACLCLEEATDGTDFATQKLFSDPNPSWFQWEQIAFIWCIVFHALCAPKFFSCLEWHSFSCTTTWNMGKESNLSKGLFSFKKWHYVAFVQSDLQPTLICRWCVYEVGLSCTDSSIAWPILWFVGTGPAITAWCHCLMSLLDVAAWCHCLMLRWSKGILTELRSDGHSKMTWTEFVEFFRQAGWTRVV